MQTLRLRHDADAPTRGTKRYRYYCCLTAQKRGWHTCPSKSIPAGEIGVPKKLVIDNLKAAVAHPDWFDPEITPKVQSFAQHYGIVILPTKPYTPQHKGKVESGIKYIKNNALKGRTFASLEEQNAYLAEWERSIADTRIHGTIKQQVGKLFTEVERSALLPLPPERFPNFHEAQRKVSRDGHIEVAKAYYSTPPEYLRRTVWVRWDARVVRIFNTKWEPIAMHVRHEPGRFSTQGEHLHPHKINSLEQGAAYLLDRVQLIGSHASQWAQAMLHARGIAGTRVLQGVLSLSEKHDRENLDKACEIALSHGVYRLKTIKQGFAVLYRSIFDVVREFLHDEAVEGQEKVLTRYLKPDLLIIDDMGMKQLPKRSGEYLFEIIMRRYEMTSSYCCLSATYFRCT